MEIHLSNHLFYEALLIMHLQGKNVGFFFCTVALIFQAVKILNDLKLSSIMFARNLSLLLSFILGCNKFPYVNHKEAFQTYGP